MRRYLTLSCAADIAFINCVCVCVFLLMKQELTACTFSIFCVPVYTLRHIWNNLGKIIFQRARVRISNYAVGAIFCRERSRKGTWSPPPQPPQTCIAARCHHSLQRGRQERWKSAPLFHEVTFVSQLLSDAGEDDEFWMNAWTPEEVKQPETKEQSWNCLRLRLRLWRGSLAPPCEGTNLSCGDNFRLICNIGSFEKMGTAVAAVITGA